MIGKLWLKFETIINKILGIIVNAFVFVYKKTTPQKLQDKINSKYADLNQKASVYAGKVKSKLKPKEKEKEKEKAPEAPRSKINQFFGKTRHLISTGIEKSKHLDVRKVDYKALFTKIFKWIDGLISPYYTRVAKKLKSIDQNTYVVLVVSFAVLSLIILGIVKSSRNIYDGVKNYNKEEIVKAKEKPKGVRESYFKRVLPAKQLNVYEVTLPIYIDSINSVRTLLIDLTLVTSNRYTREYLFKHSYLIKDRLNNTVHPVIPDFPLTLEGKTIIREKVIREVNKLLKEHKIEGEIKEVNFQTIIAA